MVAAMSGMHLVERAGGTLCRQPGGHFSLRTPLVLLRSAVQHSSGLVVLFEPGAAALARAALFDGALAVAAASVLGHVITAVPRSSRFALALLISRVVVETGGHRVSAVTC